MLKFKNDKERIAFLVDYRNEANGWYKWKSVPELERNWWRYDLSSCSFIVEEQMTTFSYPQKHEEWRVKEWFVVEDWEQHFGDCHASRSIALAFLKEEQKK